MALFVGTNQADILNGTDLSDEIKGRAGDDRLFGRGGNDEIEGGRGNDLLDGGLGNDELEGGLGHDSLFGGVGNDELDGGHGNDVLEGGAGNDRIEGDAGNDTMTGGDGADIFEFERGDGRDVITDFRNGEDRLKFESLNAAGVQTLIQTARQEGDDVVLTLSPDTAVTIRNMQVSQLDFSDFAGVTAPRPTPPAGPKPGLDILGTNGSDVLNGGAGNDDIDGLMGHDQLRGGAGNDELDGDAGNDNLWGEDGNDDLDGGAGNDQLFGGAGNDTLEGGTGNDALIGGGGADVFEFERGEGNDIIVDFRNGEDRIDLDDFSLAQAMAVINAAQQVGANVVLAVSAGSTITINNMQLAQLDISDFIL